MKTTHKQTKKQTNNPPYKNDDAIQERERAEDPDSVSTHFGNDFAAEEGRS